MASKEAEQVVSGKEMGKKGKEGEEGLFSYVANAQKGYEPPMIANGNAFLGDVFSTTDIGRDHPLSAGFYHLAPGPELVYTYTYDEMKILLEGDMQIAQLSSSPAPTLTRPTEEGKSGIKEGEGKGGEEGIVKAEVDAKAGDVFFFPKGSVIRFRTRGGGKAWFVGARARDGA
ncbi:MAG: hypothetical protein Q9218_003609 [Villophora microphyllina]